MKLADVKRRFEEQKAPDFKSDVSKYKFSYDNFYRLPKDKDGNGEAVIRFIPDKEGEFFVDVYMAKAERGYKNRFISWVSPRTCGGEDLINERFMELWGAGEKEEAKKFKVYKRIFANILVVKDPRNPENEGKVFLLDMSQKLYELLFKDAEGDEDRDLKQLEPFDIPNGNDFKLISEKDTNNIVTYTSRSGWVRKPRKIARTKAELKELIEKTYLLSDYKQCRVCPSLEEQREALDYYDGVNASSKSEKAPEKAPENTPEKTPEKKKEVEKPKFDMDDMDDDAPFETEEEAVETPVETTEPINESDDDDFGDLDSLFEEEED